MPFSSWDTWTTPWNSGLTSALIPVVVAGNPQGYVLIKGQGTNEGVSGSIENITTSGTGLTQITSINHCVQEDDYLQIQNVLGLLTSTITAITLSTPTNPTTTITTVNTFVTGDLVTISGVVGTNELNGNTYTIIAATGAAITLNVNSFGFTPYTSGGIVTSAINGLIGQVSDVIDLNTFVIDILAPTFAAAGYLGLGQYIRLSQPLLQSKQFPAYWEQGRKVRISAQKYLLDRTSNGQITLNIFLSEDAANPWNDPKINIPPNSSLIYTQLVYTCPESTNLGLTPANTNLQMPTASTQNQIWHRMNTSLIGDTVQLGFTLSDDQMRNIEYATSEIILHAIDLTLEKGPLLA